MSPREGHFSADYLGFGVGEVGGGGKIGEGKVSETQGLQGVRIGGVDGESICGFGWRSEDKGNTEELGKEIEESAE